MLTVGVDLAAAEVRTAIAAIDWAPGRARVRELRVGVTDAEIVAAVLAADKAGLDCPLGWPDPFVDFLSAHRSGRVAPPPDRGATEGEAQREAQREAQGEALLWRRRLAFRLTDEMVREQAGLIPLSVSADRIGHAAFRCAGLLAMLSDEGRPVDRSGAGVVVEVYPAAALRRWGLTHRGYKTPGQRASHAPVLEELLAAAPWLSLGPHEPLCRASHDAMDAVIAALAARAAALGHAIRPDKTQLDRARTEGWIALPTGTLDDLVAAEVA